MHLASLNGDVLFYLIKFVDPVDRFNLVLSGILKGFENLRKVINVEHRITNFKIVLRPCRDRMGQLEIRSLEIGYPSNEASIKCCEIFERLVEEGFLKNNRELYVSRYSWPHIPRFLGYISCSMKNLDRLRLYYCPITLEQLSTLFRSCPDLVELSVDLDVRQTLEMDDHMKNELRRSFQKLKLLTLWVPIDNDSWPVIPEIVTWLKEYVEPRECNAYFYSNLTCGTGRSLTLNPTLAQNLQRLTLEDTPVGFIRMILPSRLLVYTLDNWTRRDATKLRRGQGGSCRN